MHQFFKLFRVLDKLIENRLKALFHARREELINKAILGFAKHHPEFCDQDTHKLKAEYESILRAKFEVEIDRVYSIVDRSVLRDRVWRARYTFWGTAIMSVVVIGSMGAFSSGNVLPFLYPLINASVAWVLSVSTISISYYQRIKGGLDSVINTYVKELLSKENDSPDFVEQNNENNDVVIAFDKIPNEETSVYLARALSVLTSKDIDELTEDDSISESLIASESGESNQDVSDTDKEVTESVISEDILNSRPQVLSPSW